MRIRSGGKQKGMSFVGIMWLILTIGIAGTVGLKLFPAYLEYYKVGKAFETVVMSDPDIATKDHRKIWSAFSRNFGVNDIRNVKKDSLTVVREKNSKIITLSYERRVPMFKTLETVVVFNRSLTVK